MWGHFFSLRVYVHLKCLYLHFDANLERWPTVLASDNVNEDKPVSFVVKQLGSSFNLKMHLDRGGGRRLKPSPSYGARQRARQVRHRDGHQAGEGKVGTIAGLDWLDNLCTFFFSQICLTLECFWYRGITCRPIKAFFAQKGNFYWLRWFEAGSGPTLWHHKMKGSEHLRAAVS